MEDFMKEEKKITSQFDHDPIAKLRARELDIRALDNEKRRREAEEKLNLEKMRAMMNQQVKKINLNRMRNLLNLELIHPLKSKKWQMKTESKLLK